MASKNKKYNNDSTSTNIGIVIKDTTSIGTFSYRKWDEYPDEKKKNVKIFVVFLFLIWILTFVYLYFMAYIHQWFVTQASPITDPTQKWLLEHVPSLFDTIVCIIAFFSIFYVLRFIRNIIRFKSQKSKTLWGLTFSVLNYILFIVYFLVILGGWGANVAAIWASAGVLTLIIGFGAKSLVEDLFTGVVIAIEGNIEVGDTVFYENFNGTVREIGLRVTQIEDIYSHVMIVRNSEIKKIVNTSKHVLYHELDFAVPNKYPSSDICKLLSENCERIKSVDSKINDVRVYGVSKFDNWSSTYAVLFSCEKNSHIECGSRITQELRKILDENKISA